MIMKFCFQKLTGFGPECRGGISRCIQVPDSSLNIDSPPVAPVSKVEGSVRTEVDSNSQNSGHRFNFRSQFEGGPIFVEVKGVERGVSARATERHDKEVLLPLLAQCRTGIVFETGRP